MHGPLVSQDGWRRTREEDAIKKARQADLLAWKQNDDQTFLKINEPLVPPKPKELHSVYSIPLT